MGYLLPAEYAAYGLTAETADAWVTTASTMIEAYCRRPTLLAASYTERMRVPLRSADRAPELRAAHQRGCREGAVRST